MTVMRHAINQVAGTLPIGARQAAILDQMLIDLQLDPQNRQAFPTNNRSLIFPHLFVPGASRSVSSSPSSSLNIPAYSVEGTRKGTGGPRSINSNSSGGGKQQQQKSHQGATFAEWAMDGNGEVEGGGVDGRDRVMEEMREMQAPWEGFN